MAEAPLPTPNNTGMPDQLKAGIESLSGMNMDHVKVHYNSSRPAQLQAHAFAQGKDIHVAPGQEKHLPHEAWHIVQQAQGRVKPTLQMKSGAAINDDASLETEADLMGAKALQQQTHSAPVQKISASNDGPMQFVLTRSMQKIINETEFKSNEDFEATKNWLMLKFSKNETVVNIILNGILDRQNSKPPTQEFAALTGESNEESNDTDEVEINYVDHGDLNEYDDGASIEKAVAVMQLARKGGTVSGPKSYTTSGGSAFKNVAYKTDGKGCIDFSSCHSQVSWANPILSGSEVNLSDAKKPINTKDRAQHFAIGDFLYAKLKGFGKASDTTNMRKGKWTWHHLPTQYKMVLVDMTVHAKHGHNGGVYLW